MGILGKMKVSIIDGGRKSSKKRKCHSMTGLNENSGQKTSKFVGSVQKYSGPEGRPEG